MEIKLTGDMKAAMKYAGRYFKKQVPFATTLALTRTGQSLKKRQQLEIKQIFSNPTRWTKNALKLTPARTNEVKTGRGKATVWLIDPAWHKSRDYLQIHVKGGERPHSKFEEAMKRIGVIAGNEKLVAGKHMPRNKFGNITRGTYQKILSQLHAHRDYNQNATGSKASKRNRRTQAFWVVRGKGIYMRRGRQVIPAFVIVKGARYRRRWRFEAVSRRHVASVWPGIYSTALAQAIRTAK